MDFLLLVALLQMTDCPQCSAPAEDILFASGKRRANQSEIRLLKFSPKPTLGDLCLTHRFSHHLACFCQPSKNSRQARNSTSIKRQFLFTIKYVIELIFQGFHYHHKETLMGKRKNNQSAEILLPSLSWGRSLHPASGRLHFLENPKDDEVRVTTEAEIQDASRGRRPACSKLTTSTSERTPTHKKYISFILCRSSLRFLHVKLQCSF